MEGDEALLDIGSLNYDFGGSEKNWENVFKNKDERLGYGRSGTRI